MSSVQAKRGLGRAALQRKTTRGPLDAEDPLSTSQSLTASPSAEPLSFPPVGTPELDASLTAPSISTEPAIERSVSPPPAAATKDLSFLLDASIYHPLSNIDVPAPYRYPLPPPPPATTPLTQIFDDITKLLKQCHFLSAAHLAASTLTSGLVPSTDTASVFRLLSVRYSALELSGNVLLAAQESKALEDLSSSFYYEDAPSQNEPTRDVEGDRPLLRHIMPFDLRLQAMRLQGIGFGDSRRTVGALFDLGLEIREIAARSNASDQTLWGDRLEEVGLRVINALIDLGDLECARRSLQSMVLEVDERTTIWVARLVLLMIKMGEIDEARKILDRLDIRSGEHHVLQALIEVAEEHFEEAVAILSTAESGGADPEDVAIAEQNLAVAYLYTGEIEKSRQILADLVDKGYSFHTLTVNLATLYDLTSDRSKELKSDMAMRIANTKPAQPQRGFVNADFKL